MNPSLTHKIVELIREYFSIDKELENHDYIYEEIKKGIIFKGTNLWILIFAIIVASVGLNMNSTAVIIGAMLISPLMGPINGMGYSVATYDFDLFKKSIRNFSFAILASLVASTLYFALSPVSTAHSELLARTSPTIYDVLIALFGGLAGIVAISSKQKGNVIPGVAIATALMPPLCTAGYGIATGQFEFFLGAFYLFTINTIFIAIASVWISQLLKFPIRTIVDASQRKKTNQVITFVISIVLLPSIFFGYKLVEKEKFTQEANKFISNVSSFEGNYLLKSEINADKKTILLIYGGTTLSEIQKNLIIKKSKDFGLQKAVIGIEQGLSFSNYDEKSIEVIQLKEQLNLLSTNLKLKNQEIDSVLNASKFGKVILDEIQNIFPEIDGCLFANSSLYQDTLNIPKNIPVVLLTTKSPLTFEERVKLINWLKTRVNNNDVRVFID